MSRSGLYALPLSLMRFVILLSTSSYEQEGTWDLGVSSSFPTFGVQARMYSYPQAEELEAWFLSAFFQFLFLYLVFRQMMPAFEVPQRAFGSGWNQTSLLELSQVATASTEQHFRPTLAGGVFYGDCYKQNYLDDACSPSKKSPKLVFLVLALAISLCLFLTRPMSLAEWEEGTAERSWLSIRQTPYLAIVEDVRGRASLSGSTVRRYATAQRARTASTPHACEAANF